MTAPNDLELALQTAQTAEERARALNNLAEALIESDPARTLELAEQALRTLDAIAPSPFKDEQTAFALATLGMGEFKFARFEKAIARFREAQEIATRIGDKRLLLRILNAQGNAHWNLSNYAEALRLHHQRLELAEALDDELAIATSLHNIGNAYLQLAEYDKALNVYQKSLSLKEKLGDEREIAMSLMNIGSVYYLIGDLDQALVCYEKSLELKRKNAVSPSSLGHSLVNLGNIHYEQKRYEQALRWYEEAYETLKGSPDLLARSQALGNIASALSALDRKRESLEKHLECLNLREAIDHKQGVVIAHNAIGVVYQDLGEDDKAERHLLKAVELAEAINAKREMASALNALAQFYKHQKNFERALHYCERYHAVEREAFNEAQAKRLRETQAIYETEQARKETQREKERNAELQKALDEAEKQKQIALEANAVKTQLLSIAAHDLKTPLQTIIGFAALIRETPPSDIQTAYDFSTHIESAANRMLNLVNEMLKSNEFEIGDVALDLKLVRLDELLRSAVYEHEFLAQKKAQTLLIERLPEVALRIDRNRIREVLDNLISNAIKYSPVGKTIRVSLDEAPAPQRHNDARQDSHSVVRISVKDEGQGLSETDMKKLFGRFQRLSARPTGDETSTGLGLFIVKRIVELHGGSVWAESEGKGKGATFIVELPKRSPE